MMGKYRLWLDSFEKVCKYGIPFLRLSKGLQETITMQQRYKNCQCLKFVVNREIRDTFSLTEIDSLTTGYSNEEEFLEALEKATNGKYKKKAKEGLVATHQYQKQVKQIDIVYNSPLLQKYAMLERHKATSKVKANSSKLKDTDQLQQLCVKLLRLVEEKNTRNYVLNPQELGEEVDKKEKQKLSQYLPKYRSFETTDLEKYRQIYDNQLYHQLDLYAKKYDAKKEKEAAGLSAYQEEQELIQGQNRVYNALRKDYRTLRSTILFLKTYEVVTEKLRQVDNQVEEYDGQLELFSDSTNQLHILDPYAKAAHEEHEKIQIENADILAQIAYENNQKWQKKYEEEPAIIDDYSFEEREDREDVLIKKENRRYG